MCSKLILYTTKGCFACGIMKRICNEIANDLNIDTTSIDIDDLPDEVKHNSLDGFKDFPTIIFKHQGREMFRLVGTYPIDYIKECINKVLLSK